MTRTAAGVIGLKLLSGDSVVACAAARPDATLLHVTTSGYGKRTRVERFPRKHRAGLGVKGIKLVQDKGEVVGTLVVDPEDEILVATRNGVVIRIPAAGVSVQDRWACGVTVMSPDPGDEVVAIALVGDDINGNSNQDPSEHPEAEPDAQ